jgi:hypothetical protein
MINLIRRPTELADYENWTQVLEEIQNPLNKNYRNKKWFKKNAETVIPLYWHFNYGGDVIEIDSVKVSELLMFVEMEKNGYVHPKIEKPEIIYNEDSPPF